MITLMNILRFSTPGKILLALIILSPLTVSAGVYKWTDAQGNVHYGSERPADTETEKLNIEDGSQYNPYADPAVLDAKREDTKKSKELAKEKAKQKKEKQQKATPPPVAEKPKMPKKEKKRRCQQARDTLASIQSKGRLREIDDQGNYSYASEKQRQKRMALEKGDIKEYCR